MNEFRDFGWNWNIFLVSVMKQVNIGMYMCGHKERNREGGGG